MPKAPHHRGTYHAASAKVRAAANADPETRCWRCGLTLPEHKPHRNGKPATWTAGHTTDSQPGGHLAPEASTCNYAAGGRLARARARTAPARPRRRSRNW
jgi:hypothetical protein